MEEGSLLPYRLKRDKPFYHQACPGGWSKCEMRGGDVFKITSQDQILRGVTRPQGPLAQVPLAHDSRVQELEAQQLAFEEEKMKSDTNTCLSPAGTSCTLM